MERLTVRLPEELGRALRVAAVTTHRWSSEIVRRALRQYLGLGDAGATRPADRVRALLGSLESGAPVLTTGSRQILLESLRRGG